MTPETTLLVVVDMQNGFLNERSRHVVPRVVGVVDAWRHLGGEVIFTRFLNAPGSPFERLIHWSRLQGPPDTGITSELRPYVDGAAGVIDKPYYTLLTPTGIEVVREEGWRDLVFCGVATDGCVLKSAVDAFELGYTPWVLTDACASHAGAEVHEAGLTLLRRFIGRGQLVDSAGPLARLRSRDRASMSGSQP